MKAANTADKIVAAGRVLLEMGGAEAVTMRRTAAAVGLTAMALYRHFPNREGLLRALADEGFSELAGKLARTRGSGDVERRFAAVLDVFLTYALKNPRIFELMFLTPREGARQYPRDFQAGRSPTANIFAELLEEGMAMGHFREDDVWAIVFEMGALLQGLIMLYLGGRVDMSAAKFRSFCHQALRRYLLGIRC